MATVQERPSSPAAPAENPLSEGHRHRVLLLLSDEMRARIDDLMRRTGYDQGELFDMAITCFMMGLDAVEAGKRVGVVDDGRAMETEFTGFHKNDPIVE